MLGDDLASRPARHTRSRVLRLRGLPYRAVEEDIQRFFAPLAVARVYICRRNGRTTGEAYAEFVDSSQAEEALRTRNRQHLGNRYIELFEAGPSEVERFVASSSGGDAPAVAQPQPNAAAVEVLGLPATVSTEEVLSFFSGIELSPTPDRISLFSSQDNRRGAIVVLNNSEAQAQALSRSQTLFNGRPVQVLPYNPRTEASSTAGADIQDRPAQPTILLSSGQYQQIAAAQSGQTYPFRTDGSTLKLRGLPYSAGDTDVITFFEGFQVGPKDVHLEVRSDRPAQSTGTGIAYVQFSNSDEAERARHSKHKQMMGPRYIECMIFIPGRQYLARNPPPAVTDSTWPLYQPALRPLMPASAAGTNPFSSSAALASSQMFGEPLSQRLQSGGWPRPYLDPRPFSPPMYGPMHAQAVRSGSGNLRPRAHQGGSGEQAIVSGLFQSPAAAGQTGQQQVMQHMPGPGQGPSARPPQFGLSPQQQQLLLQQQFAMQQQQQQQLLLQQQALQAQWGGLQQGGWLRAFPGMPLALPPGAPLQMQPRPGLQGGLGIPGQPLAYFAPGAPFGWTPMHPGQAALMGGGLQNFQPGVQHQQPIYRPAQLGPDQRQLAQSPFGARTPGRGRFRTPFTQPHPAESLEPSVAEGTQDMQQLDLAPVGAIGPETSALTMADATSPFAAFASNLESLSLADEMPGSGRLRPVVTHTSPAPSEVILASAARSSSPDLGDAPPIPYPAFSDQAYTLGLPSSEAQALEVSPQSAASRPAATSVSPTLAPAVRPALHDLSSATGLSSGPAPVLEAKHSVCSERATACPDPAF